MSKLLEPILGYLLIAVAFLMVVGKDRYDQLASLIIFSVAINFLVRFSNAYLNVDRKKFIGFSNFIVFAMCMIVIIWFTVDIVSEP